MFLAKISENTLKNAKIKFTWKKSADDTCLLYSRSRGIFILLIEWRIFSEQPIITM